jgi:hypothetical protein
MGPPHERERRAVPKADVIEDLEELDELEPLEPLADEEPPPPEPVMEQVALDHLKRMAATLQAAQRFTLRAETTAEEFLARGQSIELSAVVEAMVRRPDGVLIERVTDRHHRRFHYDGKSVALIDLDKNLYATRDDDVPGTITETLDRVQERFGVTMPLSDLVVSDPYAALSDYADSGLYLGEHRVRGVKCHHLAFANEFLEWQVWIAAEGPPVPRQLVITYVEEPGAPRYRAFLSDWDLDAKFGDEVFAFTPPDGAKRIEIAPAPQQDEEGEE